MRTGAVVLAAGAGRRFGGVKQLAPLHGRPLLEHALGAVRMLTPRVVVLGHAAEEILARVDLQGARPVICERWAEGQSASLRAGVAALGDVDAALVTLGDQPFITAAVVAGTLDRLDAGRWDAVRATYAGAPGHPVALGRAVIERLGELRGDAGARDLLARFRVREWEAGDLRSALDVDTPAALLTTTTRE